MKHESNCLIPSSVLETHSPSLALSAAAGKAFGVPMRLCTVPGCGRRHYGQGYCSPHLQRLIKHGDLRPSDPISRNQKGDKNHNWRGGIVIDPDGRVLIYCPDHPNPSYCGSHVYRYRLVAEHTIGRYLNDDEIVHHIDSNPQHDCPENLQVMTQSEHARLHKQTRNHNKNGELV